MILDMLKLDWNENFMTQFSLGSMYGIWMKFLTYICHLSYEWTYGSEEMLVCDIFGNSPKTHVFI
jgi:hypothetical protein